MNNENLNSNVNCPICGAINMANTRFCIKCGNPMHIQNANPTPLTTSNQPAFNNSVTQNPIEKEFNQARYNQVSSQGNANPTYQATFQGSAQPTYKEASSQVNSQPTHNQSAMQSNAQPVYSQSTIQTDSGSLNYFKYILNAFLKPFDTFKNEEKKLSVFKNSAILVGIIVVALTVLNLISTMITTVRVTSLWTKEVKWVWENLKYIKYFKIIAQNLLVYSGVLLSISGIYTLASLVIKKSTSFVKLLSATATSFIPLAVASAILSPILSLIYSPLGLIITIVGFIYSLIILLELFNDLINIENKNTRIYFHLVCLSVVLIGGGFIAYKVILGSFTGGLGSLLG